MNEEPSGIPNGGGEGRFPAGLNGLEMQDEEGGGISRTQAAIITAVVVILLGGAYVFLSKIPAVRADGDSKAGIEKIRREYLERNAFAVGVADQGRYAEERRSLFKWYKNQLTEHENKFPGSVDITGFEKELKRKDGRQAEQYEKRYREVKEFWSLIDSGKYIPVFTAADGGLRFDITRLEPVSSGGEPAVRLHFALYGIQRVWLNEQNDNGSHTFRMKTNLKFDQFKVDGRDASGKQKFEMSIAGGEPFNVNYPERFISEFPPGMVLGYYEIPRLPEADKVELSFSIATRSVVSGLEGLGTFSWQMSSAEMPPELKLPSGQEWKNAETRIVDGE